MIDGGKYVLTDNDLNELKKKIIQKESELQNGIYSKNLRLTLNEWFDKWINLYKGNVKITTRELYMRTWDSYVRDSQIGNMQIDRIKRVHIVELYKELSGKTESGNSYDSQRPYHRVRFLGRSGTGQYDPEQPGRQRPFLRSSVRNRKRESH